MVIVLGAVRWRGESNWLFSALLFLPAAFWLAPLLFLTPIHLLVWPRLCGVTLLAFLALYFVYLDFAWAFSSDKDESGLTVLTNNIGERQFETLAPFLKREHPDVIALQDIWSSRVDFRKEFPGRFVSTVGEYVLVSRFPIYQSEYIYPFAARFELDYHGERVVIYQIHMPSPRSEFAKLRGRGVLRELIGGGGFRSKGARD